MNIEKDKMQTALKEILSKYQKGFSDKVYCEENDETDLLMGVFGITQELKRENRQYWGRELGMCWQRLVVEVCKQTNPTIFKGALKFEKDEPCDLVMGKQAIDTKYRVGSGDSGTLKKFKAYGKLLKEEKLNPVLLIVREDNLENAITACKKGGWDVKTGQETFCYLKELTGFDIESFLKSSAFKIKR